MPVTLKEGGKELRESSVNLADILIAKVRVTIIVGSLWLLLHAWISII
jgi:hypothetical protein